MSRFLFVVPPLTGHTLPAVAVAAELSARGHEVAWAGHAGIVAGLLPSGARIFDVDGADEIVALREQSRGLRGAAAFQFLWRDFLIPLADAMVPAVERAVAEYAPDVLVVDQQAVAGAVVARRRGLPWATSATTSAELTDPFALMPKLGDWAREQLLDLARRHGAPDDGADLRFSDHLVIAFTTSALIGPVEGFGDHYAFVGPSIGARVDVPTFPWQWIDPARRLVLVSLGTVSRESGDRFFDTVLAALDPMGAGVQAVVVAPPDRFPRVPENVLVREYVPQLDLLPYCAAVVTHAGHNTVCEALSHGVPLVVAPIRDDQPIVAQQVVDAGAGIRVRYGRVGADELRAVLMDVLDDRAYRAAARRVGTSFDAAGGAATAADRLEKLT